MLEQFQALMTWLNANQNGVSALASVVLTVTTIVYAWHTSVLAKENRLLREAGTKPQVIAFLSPNLRHIGAIEFVIANIGRGPAYAVTYKIVSGGDDFKTKGVRITDTKVPMNILPQDEQVRRFLGEMAWDLLAEPTLKPFDVRVEYQDAKGYSLSRTFRMNIEEFLGVGKLNTAEDDAAEALKKIAHDIEAWRRAWSSKA